MKKSKLPNLVVILILTLITVVMWISFNIYRAVTSAPPPVVPPEVSKPLNPNLDNEALNQIESRIFIDDSQIPDNVVTQQSLSISASTPTPTVTSIPETTPAPSAESPTPAATPTPIL